MVSALFLGEGDTTEDPWVGLFIPRIRGPHWVTLHEAMEHIIVFTQEGQKQPSICVELR